MLPPCFSINDLLLASPNPVPFVFVVNNGSNILSIISFGIPGPESANSISIVFVFIYNKDKGNRIRTCKQ